MSSCEWEDDPGPCPVDDTPHTACTSPDYLPLEQPISATGGTRVTVPLATFSTKTYRRQPPVPSAVGKTPKPPRRR